MLGQSGLDLSSGTVCPVSFLVRFVQFLSKTIEDFLLNYNNT